VRLNCDSDVDLTYCTNIHPGSGWDEVRSNLESFAPALKRRLAPDTAFGLGLRLSAAECTTLLEAGRLREFAAYLDDHDLYVRLLNGFVHGSFYRQVVKADVFAPDWRNEARLAYTLDLVQVLAGLLPEGAQGGISTMPLSYKPWLRAADEDVWEVVTRNIARAAAAMVRLRETSGRMVHLDIEPEPDGLIENTAEAVAFFENWLLRDGARYLGGILGVSTDQAALHLRDHVRLCVDCCHLAVEYETPEPMWERLSTAGIKVGRLQVSSAIEADLPDDPSSRAALITRLRPFVDSTYLHQVIEQAGGATLRGYRDLDEAMMLAHEQGDRRWRVHFHVPVFVQEYNGLNSTQSYTVSALDLLRRTGFTQHLEIETYTWDVLPPGLKVGLLDSVDREYRWVLNQLRGGVKQPTEKVVM